MQRFKHWAPPVGLFLLMGGLVFFLMPTVDLPQGNIHKTQHTITAIEDALAAFKKDMGRYPTTAEGIKALLENPQPGSTDWKGPYGREIETDQWGHPFSYIRPGPKGQPYLITSPGPDNKFGDADDITSQ
jgi:general secretion pathway protein G